jgi:D-psicose/D-tagatose/L-ribulose 3-epimerase
MKIGVSAFAWTTRFQPEHLRVIPSLRKHGIAGFEIPMFNPAEIDANAIRSAMEKHEIECTVCAILPPGMNPISPDEATRRKSVEHLLECVTLSAEMGAKLLGGPLYAPIGYLPARRRTDEEWKWAVECFQRVGDLLAAREMNLSIEPVNRSETFFLKTVAEAKAFCEAVDNPRVGITIDTFHANIEEKNILDASLSAGQRLMHVHVSENDRGLLGSGHIDFPGIVSSLKKRGYEGFLMIEGFGYSRDETNLLGRLWADPSVSPEDIAFQGTEYLRNLLNSDAAVTYS